MDTPKRFSLGHVVATPGVLDRVSHGLVSAVTLLARHSVGDWGDISPDDRGVNEAALLSGARLLSVYTVNDTLTVWILTEAADDDGTRAATTLLLPDEY